MQNKKIIIVIAAFLIIFGFAGWYIYRDLKLPENSSLTDVEHRVSNTNSERMPPAAETIKIKIPNPDREIIVKTNLPEATKNKIIGEIKEISKNLKKDYDNREGWLQLGLLRKALEDYEGASEAWEFLAFIRPKDSVVLSNLGELYWLYLPDYPRSEKYFQKAIENDPNNVIAYEKLHELYRYSYKEKSNLAANILLQGIKVTDDPALKALLEEYQQEQKP